MKRLYDIICVILLIFTFLIFVFLPNTMKVLTREALSISFNTVIPSLFPFMVITQLLSRTGIAMNAGRVFSFILSPLFGIPKNLCGAFITGIIGGFPNGAYSCGIVYSKGLCTKEQAERCIALSNNCSLSFLIAVAGIHSLGSVQNGILIAVSQFISIFFVSLILRMYGKNHSNSSESCVNKTYFTIKSLPQTITASITQSVINMFNICGFIIAFSVISGIVTESLAMGITASAIIKGVFEISSGIVLAKDIYFPLNFIVCSAVLGFSSLSVMLQVTEAAASYGLSSRQFVMARLINAVIMPAVTSILLMIVPSRFVSVFYPTLGSLSQYGQSSLAAAVLYAAAFAFVMLFLAALYFVSLMLAKKSDNTKRKID